MNFDKRRVVWDNLKQYCHLAKPNDIVEVTEWTNGEGWDVVLGNRNFYLTMGELQALTVLCNTPHPKEIA
jgi:hypothetical protein